MIDRRALMTGATTLALMSDLSFAASAVGRSRDTSKHGSARDASDGPVGGLMDRHYLYTGGYRVHYRRHGTGGAVVMLAGFPNSSVTIDGLAAMLPPAVSAIALDLPGTGESSPLTDASGGVAGYAGWLAEVTGALGLAAFDLVAFETSAPVAIAFARANSGRVRRLVLIEPLTLNDHEKAQYSERGSVPLIPDPEGSHVTRHWGRLRDSYIFDPWYDRSMVTRMARDLPPADRLYTEFLDVMRAGPNYLQGLQAAWKDDRMAEATGLANLTVLASNRTAQRLSGKAIQVLPVAARDDFAGIATHMRALALGRGLASPPPPPAVKPVVAQVRRDYVRTSIGQILMRWTAARKPGKAPPLFVFHGSLWSSVGLEPKLLSYSDDRDVLCFDMPGVGDSPAIGGNPDMAAFARIVVEAIETLGFDAIDLEGGHSGAMAAIDVAVLMPDKVRHVILNGVTMFSDAELAEMLPHYLRPLNITDDGAFLNWSWQFLRDMYLWYPWYDHRWKKARSDARVPSAEQQHDSFVDFLKGGRSFAQYYHAALTFATKKRVPLMKAKVLFCCEKIDTLLAETVAAAKLLPGAKFILLPDRSTPEGRTATDRLYFDFLEDRSVG
jgi:pimeloyl-ACP methyl ester carboxylesterase